MREIRGVPRWVGSLVRSVFFLIVTVMSFSVIAQEKVTVFDAMRIEFADNPVTAMNKYFNKASRERWDSTVGSVQTIDDVKYFFAFSMIEMIEQSTDSTDMIYVNPWIDGAAFMRWKQEEGAWKVNDFALISGEYLRNEIIAERNALPLWLRSKGTLSANMAEYLRDTRAAMLLDKNRLSDSLTDKAKDDRTLSLIAISVRANTRIVSARSIFGDSSVRKSTQEMLIGLKEVLKSKNRERIRALLKTDNHDLVEALALLPEPLIDSFVGNWYVEKEDRLLVLMSSFLSPRLFLILESKKSGEVVWGLLGDWATSPVPTPQAAATERSPVKH